MPKYLKTGLTTVPQFFEQRYDEGTRRLVSIIVLLSYVVIMLPNILYAGAQVFVNIFGIDKMFGISRFAAIAIVCVATAIIGSIYAIFGGLKAIALSDSINGLGLIVGGLLFVFYESSISLSIGLASSAASSVEVSLVNYLWPTMMVLLAAAFVPSGEKRSARNEGIGRDPAAPSDAQAQDDSVQCGTNCSAGKPPRHSRGRAVLRVLPGAVVATAGVMLAVGGNSGLDWALAAGHVAANPLPYLLAFAGALAWSVYAVFTPALSKGFDGTSVFFPFVAVALWIIHFASGQGWPSAAPSVWGCLAVVAAAAVIAGGYACWGYGILRGSMSTLAMASYATPVLSTAASAVLLGLSLTLPFWCGALLVAAGSIINWWISSQRR